MIEQIQLIIYGGDDLQTKLEEAVIEKLKKDPILNLGEESPRVFKPSSMETFLEALHNTQTRTYGVYIDPYCTIPEVSGLAPIEQYCGTLTTESGETRYSVVSNEKLENSPSKLERGGNFANIGRRRPRGTWLYD